MGARLLSSLTFLLWLAATPSPASALSCNTGPYIVFFDWDDDTILPDAERVLANVVAARGNCGVAELQAAGHADRSGGADYNRDLSQRRIDAVRAWLRRENYPVTEMLDRPFGESVARIPTADGVREAQNRRVELVFAPAPEQPAPSN